MSEENGFAEGDEVHIDDGSGAIRAGTVLRATADAYHVDTEHGPIWCGHHQVFAPGERVAPSEAPPLLEVPPSEGPAEPGAEATATDKPKRRAKKSR